MHFDNTENVKRLAERCGLPATPRGAESFRFAVGETVTASGLGGYKAGTSFCIAERWMENGFAYYKDTRGMVHRDRDIS